MTILKIAPRPDCKLCHGEGIVTDRVDYGSTTAPMDSYCSCVEEQVSVGFEDAEIEIIESDNALITILGRLPDTAPYIGKPGYNVSEESPDWTPEKGRAWVVEAVARGDKFLLVSTDFTGVYLQEIGWLRAEAQKMRIRAGVLKARALELDEAVADVSKRALAHLGPVIPLEDDGLPGGCPSG